MASRFIVGLDIGTSSVKAIVAEEHNGRLSPRLFLKENCTGLRKGALLEVGEAVPAITKVLAEIRKFYKHALKTVYVSIGTAQIKVQHSRGIVAVSRADSEIYQEDVDRVIKASQAVNLGPNRMIIHNIVREFIVDGSPDITDPLGLTGNRLEVNSIIIDAFLPHVKNLMRAMELAGADIAGLVFSPLAGARASLSKRQKDLGVVLVDIGAGTTGMVVYEENKLVSVANFPVGAGHISNDLAIGLKIPVAAAEEVKVRFGHAIAKEIPARESVDISQFHSEGKGNVTRRFLVDIIESRLDEIFEFVDNELKLIGRSGRLAGGVVLIGGGAKLPGLAEAAKQNLRLSSQVGASVADEWMVETADFSQFLEDPEFSVPAGLALFALDQEGNRPGRGMPKLSGVKDLLRYFMP